MAIISEVTESTGSFVVYEPALSASDIDFFITWPPDDKVLKKGDVILVRSTYKHEVYGDHFALITGGIIAKERGLRPNLITFPPSSLNSQLLDKHDIFNTGIIILKLTTAAAKRVMDAYGLHLSEGEIIKI